MRMFLYPVVSLFLLAGCTERTVKKAPLFSNLGNIQFYITTSSDLAQRYFNQGVALAYGFNHAEAYRSFREKTEEALRRRHTEKDPLFKGDDCSKGGDIGSNTIESRAV